VVAAHREVRSSYIRVACDLYHHCAAGDHDVCLVEWVERFGATAFLVRTFRLLEYIVVSVDALVFVVYLATEMKNFIKETWK
jgi:hypothetical protein